MKLGEFSIAPVLDGMFRLDGGAMFGVVPRVLWERTNPPDDQNRIELALRCLLVDTGSTKLLIDTGIGDHFGEKETGLYDVRRPKPLPDALREAGTAPEEVEHVVLSHLHFDHCGGSTTRTEDGRLVPTYPNATYYIQRGEWENATRPGPRSQASYLPQMFVPLKERGQIELIDGTTEILPGVRTEITGGHTACHQIVLLESAGSKAVFWGDLIPTSTHLRLPWVMAYDLYPVDTVESKGRLLPKALEENWVCVFEHDPVVGLANLVQRDRKVFAEPVS